MCCDTLHQICFIRHPVHVPSCGHFLKAMTQQRNRDLVQQSVCNVSDNAVTPASSGMTPPLICYYCTYCMPASFPRGLWIRSSGVFKHYVLRWEIILCNTCSVFCQWHSCLTCQVNKVFTVKGKKKNYDTLIPWKLVLNISSNNTYLLPQLQSTSK